MKGNKHWNILGPTYICYNILLSGSKLQLDLNKIVIHFINYIILLLLYYSIYNILCLMKIAP